MASRCPVTSRVVRGYLTVSIHLNPLSLTSLAHLLITQVIHPNLEVLIFNFERDNTLTRSYLHPSSPHGL